MKLQLSPPKHNICVFAGASRGHDAQLHDIVTKIGGMIAARQIGLVYGGGRTGLMRTIADGVLHAGGYVHGVIPHFLANLEVAHRQINKLTTTETMHERKDIMFECSDAFLVLPGGFGTMEEALEIITWRQLKVHNKPILLFNHTGFWDSLITMWADASTAGFINPHQLKLVHSLQDIDAVADALDQIV